ncbi:alpha-amylase family glycosyl hydrolase [Vibrio sp. PP-XX7]
MIQSQPSQKFRISGFDNRRTKDFSLSYTQGPNLHKYLHEMNKEVLSQYSIVSAGEIFGAPLAQIPLFVDQRRHELDIAFMFDLIRYDRAADRWHTVPKTLADFRRTIDNMDHIIGQYGWTAFFLGNHDNPRAVSHFGDDRPQWREQSAKALATITLTQRATPFIYQGDELGMTNYPFKTLDDFSDVEVKGFWQDYVMTKKVSADELLKNVAKTSRDNARTPFNGMIPRREFTTGHPWMHINPNYQQINAKSQLADTNSVYHFYHQLIELRHHTPALSTGSYQDLDPNNTDVYAYTRTLNGQTYLIVVNFKEHQADYPLPQHLSVLETMLESNSIAPPATHAQRLKLQPWQSGIYLVNQASNAV